MAVGWGGTVAGVALIVASTGDDLWRLVALGVLCLLAGFLAGVRAPDRRILHAGLAALAGCVYSLVFSAITFLVDVAGGPDAVSWVPGGEADRYLKLGLALVAALAGGIVAARRLRPQRRRPVV